MLSLLLTLIVPVLLAAQEPPGQPSVDVAKERLQAVARARTQLAVKLGVEQWDIQVESAKQASWPNSALGCPEKGRMYAQVVTDGWAVLLKAKGGVHEVHVAGRRAVICPEKPVCKEPPR